MVARMIAAAIALALWFGAFWLLTESVDYMHEERAAYEAWQEEEMEHDCHLHELEVVP